jgi:hypothetical protein
MFPVRYELNVYILFGRNSVFNGISRFQLLYPLFYTGKKLGRSRNGMNRLRMSENKGQERMFGPKEEGKVEGKCIRRTTITRTLRQRGPTCIINVQGM